MSVKSTIKAATERIEEDKTEDNELNDTSRDQTEGVRDDDEPLRQTSKVEAI